MVVGTILQTSATERVQMILSRLITGIGNGINTVNVPIWQAESFKSHNRGVSTTQQSLLHLQYSNRAGYACYPERLDRIRSSTQHVHGFSE